MNNSIIKQMSDIVAEVMTSFQSDFEQYDKQYIEKSRSVSISDDMDGRHLPYLLAEVRRI